jgi:ribosomal protein L15
LGKGELKAKIKIEASYASVGAIQAVQKAGGEVIIKEKKQPKTV